MQETIAELHAAQSTRKTFAYIVAGIMCIVIWRGAFNWMVTDIGFLSNLGYVVSLPLAPLLCFSLAKAFAAPRAAEVALEVKIRMDEEARAAEEKRRAKAAANERQRREALERLLASASTETEKLSGYLASAERSLDRADADFRERAFAPFWDAVEEAVNQIGNFDTGLKAIARITKAYADTASALSGAVLPLSVMIPAAKARQITDRLGATIRTAQRSFEFASIYEQRRTNTLLFAGFTNLGQAISGLGDELRSSISSLGESLLDAAGALAAQEAQSAEALLGTVHSITEQLESSSVERRRFEDRGLALMTAIANHKRVPEPTLPNER